MDVTIKLQKPINVATCLRQAGYHPISDYHSQTTSWVRTLSRGHYPRFHLYLTNQPNQLKLSLHIDQKQHTIDMPGLKRHAGEYRSDIVEAEMGRIQRWIHFAQISDN